jgi:hypothetical protein
MPALAKAMATAAPMPVDEPVTSADLPSRSVMRMRSPEDATIFIS